MQKESLRGSLVGIAWFINWALQKIHWFWLSWRRDWDFLFYQRLNYGKPGFKLHDRAHDSPASNKIQQLEHGWQNDKGFHQDFGRSVAHDQHFISVNRPGSSFTEKIAWKRLLQQTELLQDWLGLRNLQIPHRLQGEIDSFPVRSLLP